MTSTTIFLEAGTQISAKPCRFCGAGLQRTFVDLGMSPLCETYPATAD